LAFVVSILTSKVEQAVLVTLAPRELVGRAVLLVIQVIQVIQVLPVPAE
jgi:hypothetical protein